MFLWIISPTLHLVGPIMPDQVEDLPEGLPIASVSDAEELEASYLFAGPIWKDEIGSIPMFSISHGIKKIEYTV